MAKGQTLIWTALPHGRDGVPPDGTLNLSVYVTPQLWNTDETVKQMQLSEFPDWIDFPAKVASMTFAVEFNGVPRSATVESVPLLRSDLWKALFDDDTLVFPYRFEEDDTSESKYLVLETSTLAEAIEKAYAEIGTDPAMGAGADLPLVEHLARTPAVSAVARPTRPEPPFRYPPRPREPVPAPDLPIPPEDRLGCLGWLFRILCWLAKYLPQLRRLLKGRCPPPPAAAVRPDYQVEPFEPTPRPAPPVMPTVSVFAGGKATAPPPPPPDTGAGAPGTFVPTAGDKAAFQATDEYFSTKAEKFASMPTMLQLATQHDFHQIVSLLGDYPALLRMLGLVVELNVPLTAPGQAAIPTIDTATVRVRSTWTPDTSPTVDVSPRTHYVLEDGVFATRPRADAAVKVSNGFLDLADGTVNPVSQIDVAGSAIKYRNAATNLVVSAHPERRPALQPDHDGLPALQTEGIAVTQKRIVDQYKASAATAKSLHNFSWNEETKKGQTKPPLPPEAANDQMDDLWADTVLRGYRIDVLDEKAGTWFSLHRRDARYDFTKVPGQKVVVEDEEGFVEPGATRQPDAPDSIRIHETLFSWQGWSLSAPRPHKGIVAAHEADPIVEHLDSEPLYGLDTWYRVRSQSLPRLRYGRNYRVRARAVDLAGNSVLAPGDPAYNTTPAEATGPVKFGRFEPLGPPSLMPRAAVEEGESVERMVVRSNFDSPAADIAADPNERHVVPPRATQALVELHGKLDIATAGGDTLGGDAATRDLASREAGTLVKRLDFATNELVVLEGAVEVETQAGSESGRYWIQTGSQFPLAYLPDPVAEGAQFLSLPGATLGSDQQAKGASPTTRVPFEGPFPDVLPFRLRLLGIPAGQAPAEPKWLPTAGGTPPAERVLVVEIPQGESRSVRYSCYMSTDSAEKMGVEEWVKKHKPARLSLFKANIDAGRHWMVMPYRTLVLVHAVRQPLAIPRITVLSATKDKGTGSAVGETAAILEGTFALHAPSTGKVQVGATWTDPFDDLGKPTFDEAKDVVRFSADVGEVQIGSPTDHSPTFELTHFVKDTKFHRIRYAPVGTTRFREYFDPKTSAAALVRPTAKEVDDDRKRPPGKPKPTEEAKREVDIPNSARPAPPRIHSIIPTFRWDEKVESTSTTKTTVTRTRVGGALRVYLERPWFSTGWGEQLGVVFAQSSQAAGLPPAERQVLITGMAADPIYDSNQLPAAEFTSASDFKPPSDRVNGKVTLAENDLTVSVAGFDVRFDSDRSLWYSDLEFAEPKAYFPFVRLALVRFQPVSVPGAHISSVVRADYAQLLPTRTAIYTFTRGLSGVVHLEVAVKGIGFKPTTGRSRTGWVGVVERRAAPTSPALEWEEVGTMAGEISGGTVLFHASFDLNGFQPDQFRVVVREYELFPADQDDPVPFPVGQKEDGPSGHRLVYADARIVE